VDNRGPSIWIKPHCKLLENSVEGLVRLAPALQLPQTWQQSTAWHSTTNKLIMFDINDVTGDMAANNIENEVQSFWAKTECEMNLNKEVS
jgi:hypothetical protein